MSTRQVVGPVIVGPDLARDGLDREACRRRSSRGGAGTGSPGGRRCRTARPREPSGLKIRRRATKPGSSGGASSSTPSAPTPKWRSHSCGRSPGVSGAGSVAFDDQVVVAERLPLLESHARIIAAGAALGGDVVRRAIGRCRRACTSGSLRIHVSWRLGVAAGVASASPRRRRRAAPRKPSALRARRRGVAPPRRTSSAAPARDHLVDALVDPGVQRLALHGQAGEQRRVAGVAASTAARRRVARGRRRAARARARCAAASVGSIAAAAAERALASSSWRAWGAAGLELARGGGRGSAGGTGGRRSSSASAARRYRPVPPTTIGRRPCCEQARRSRACARRAYSPALNGCVDGQDAEQPMLEPRLLLRRGRAGEGLAGRRRPAARRRTRRPGPRPRRAAGRRARSPPRSCRRPSARRRATTVTRHRRGVSSYAACPSTSAPACRRAPTRARARWRRR